MRNAKFLPIPLTEVKITDSFWSGRMELIAKEIIPYQWEVLNDNLPGVEPSHAVENFRIAAGKSQGEFQGMVFQDSDVAKWVEAASYSLNNYPNPKLETIIDELIDLMAEAQQPDGYLNTYYTVAEPNGRWSNFSFGHELYCAGHLIEAAVAYYQATGKKKLLEVICRYADYINSSIGPEEGKLKVYSGHEEIELALIKLYRVTGEQRYLKLAEYFIDERGKQPSFLVQEPTFGNKEKTKWFELDYHQAHRPVREQNKADGHSVRAMYLYTAMADLAIETGDETLIEALNKLWENVIKQRMYITGSLGSQGNAERFTFDYDLPNDTAYNETCASIGLIFWAHRMLLLKPDRCYGDVMERALYNGVISGISWDGKRYFYVNPLEVYPDAVLNRYDLQHVKIERQQWFGCACCPPNIARLISSLGQYIYTQSGDTIFTHLFIDSTVNVILDGQRVLLRQNSKYPWDGKIQFSIGIDKPKEFKLAFRIPGWCRNYSMKINDQTTTEFTICNGYLIINKVWRQDDRIEFELDMPVDLIQANPRVREDMGKLAIQRGPIVYCLEEIDNGSRLWNIVLGTDAKLKTEFAEDLFGGILIITGEANRIEPEDDELYRPVCDKRRHVKIKAIPYGLWGNRGPGEMLVWLSREGK